MPYTTDRLMRTISAIVVLAWCAVPKSLGGTDTIHSVEMAKRSSGVWVFAV